MVQASKTPQRSEPAAPAPAKAPPQDKDAALLASMVDREVQFTPFLAKEPIKLTPRMVQQFLCTPTKSGKLCDERQATRFVMLCKARGLNPWEGDAFIVGYDSEKGGPTFNLITAHQAFLKRAEVHPEYDGMESGVIVERMVDGKLQELELQGDFFRRGSSDDDPNSDRLLGGWARVHCKNRKISTYRRLNLAVFNTGYSRWKVDPGGQIVKCAEAHALRDTFPNSLGGMYIDGELVGIIEKQTEAPLPTGRTDLRNGKDRPPPAATEPTPPRAPEPSSSDPSPDEIEKTDSVNRISEAIGEASSANALNPIYNEIDSKREWHGKPATDKLLELFRRRVTELGRGSGGPQQGESGEELF